MMVWFVSFASGDLRSLALRKRKGGRMILTGGASGEGSARDAPARRMAGKRYLSIVERCVFVRGSGPSCLRGSRSWLLLSLEFPI